MIKTIVSTELPVDEQFRIRKNVIHHGREGLRFCVVTGTHGDELEGQMVCYELARIMGEHPEQLTGTLEIYPALNPLGIDTIQRGIPNFDLDMNRIFPGDPQGTMAEQTAHAIIEDIKGADMVIDIHSSNLYCARHRRCGLTCRMPSGWYRLPSIWAPILYGCTTLLPYWRLPSPTRSTAQARHAWLWKWA